MKQQKQSGF